MTVIFDFDYTLFDTAALMESMKAALARNGVSREDVAATYGRTVAAGGPERGYVPSVHARLLAEEIGGDAASYELVMRRCADGCDTMLYPGARALLDKLRSSGKHLCLLTRGDEEWQTAKIASTGIAGRFDRIVASPFPKRESVMRVAADAECPIVIVNDNPSETLEMAAVLPSARFILKLGPCVPPKGYPFPIVAGFEDMAYLCA